ncbi:hypothetical protein [Variovorax paradoxus]|uniref:HEPN domain-containing protein n=1 Tax=Variovorax paradoxus (strain EPS) TaxID=595537 RepID=E6VBI3_VARPE|nr:hypothetical protein [Variovorax paradoxus]ADU39783.1 hypothetical protein Varpa_5630 [Variovorax paradoxus EPS]
MSLQNLLAIGRLQAHQPDAAGIAKLLQAARRNLADAHVAQVSTDNRFDAAYKCIMQCAMLGLWANGYRTSTSQPGHHQTAIQSLGLTMGVAHSRTSSCSMHCVGNAMRATMKVTRFPPPRCRPASNKPRNCWPVPKTGFVPIAPIS